MTGIAYCSGHSVYTTGTSTDGASDISSRKNTIPSGSLEFRGSPFSGDEIEFNPTDGQLYAIRQNDTHMYRIDNWNTATPTVVRLTSAPLTPTTFSCRTRREEFQSSGG